jgi:hypothetical protein
MLPPIQPPPTPPDAASLLALPGPQFVEAVFRTLLGRDPDPQGRVFYRQRLLEGVSRLQILREFALSDEAKARGRSLPGLEAELDGHLRASSGPRHALARALRLAGALEAAQRQSRQATARADEVEETGAQQLARVQQELLQLKSRLLELEADLRAVSQGAEGAPQRERAAGAGAQPLPGTYLAARRRSPLETLSILNRTRRTF